MFCRGISNNVDHGTENNRGKKRKMQYELTNGEADDGLLGATTGTKVFALTSGPVPCNTKITNLIDIVKPHIRQLVEDANLVSISEKHVFEVECFFVRG